MLLTVNDIRHAVELYGAARGWDFAQCDVHGHPKDFALVGTHPATGVSFAVHVDESLYALAELFAGRCREAGRQNPVFLGEGI